MDALTRKRRAGVTVDREEASLNHDSNYIAALGQPEASGFPAASPGEGLGSGEHVGEASPGAMEAGEGHGAVGRPFLQASPFHSEKIRAEVEAGAQSTDVAG